MRMRIRRRNNEEKTLMPENSEGIFYPFLIPNSYPEVCFMEQGGIFSG